MEMEASVRTPTTTAYESAIPWPCLPEAIPCHVFFQFVLFQTEVSNGCVWLSEFRSQAFKRVVEIFWLLP